MRRECGAYAVRYALCPRTLTQFAIGRACLSMRSQEVNDVGDQIRSWVTEILFADPTATEEERIYKQVSKDTASRV